MSNPPSLPTSCSVITHSQKQLHFPQSHSVPDICEHAFNPLNHQLVTLFCYVSLLYPGGILVKEQTGASKTRYHEINTLKIKIYFWTPPLPLVYYEPSLWICCIEKREGMTGLFFFLILRSVFVLFMVKSPCSHHIVVLCGFPLRLSGVLTLKNDEYRREKEKDAAMSLWLLFADGLLSSLCSSQRVG